MRDRKRHTIVYALYSKRLCSELAACIFIELSD